MERGAQQLPAYRALLLLGAAFPETSLEELAKLPIGMRNRHLLLMRKQLFGGALMSVVHCPTCQAPLELTLQVDELLTEPTRTTAWRKRMAGYTLKFRLPNSFDLLNLPQGEVEHARNYLLARCVTEVKCKGQVVDVTTLPDKVLTKLNQNLADADPQAVMELALSCPDCQHRWHVPLDIASFLWQELEHWAKRSLLEVHQLARAYGWSEDTILNLSPWRRQAYLALVAG